MKLLLALLIPAFGAPDKRHNLDNAAEWVCKCSKVTDEDSLVGLNDS